MCWNINASFPKGQRKIEKYMDKVYSKASRHRVAAICILGACSAHFETSCFTQRLDLGLEVDKSQARTKRWLNRDAYPTIDTVVPVEAAHEISMQERRQVI